jgi:hypothetical protein
MKHNPVNEAPKTQAVQQTGHRRRELTNHPRRVRATTGHGGTVPTMHWLRHDKPKLPPRCQALLDCEILIDCQGGSGGVRGCASSEASHALTPPKDYSSTSISASAGPNRLAASNG